MNKAETNRFNELYQRHLRYRVFLLTTYSMGLRLGETLSLQVGDIDGERKPILKAFLDSSPKIPDLAIILLLVGEATEANWPSEMLSKLKKYANP